jgi:predicted ArsR family transcriptional regulator
MGDSRQITNHEEIRSSLEDFGGSATAGSVAADLIIGTSTARRYLEDLVIRGWVTRCKAISKNPYNGRYVPMVTYSLTSDAGDGDW